MRLAEYLDPRLVVLELQAGGVDETIRALVDHLADHVAEAGRVEESLLAREAIHTTALGRGVAVPHATVAGLERPLVLIAVSRSGVAFGPVGLDPVHLFFVLLSPADRAGLHIKLLARIARLARHPGLLEALRSAASREAVIAELRRVDAEHV
jgi:nitrogen PTS system EIIA component